MEKGKARTGAERERWVNHVTENSMVRLTPLATGLRLASMLRAS